MTSYEGLREDRASETTTTVPTLAQRNGDFSQTFAQNGQLIRIFDPFTTRPNPSGSGFIRDPFPNNVIPADRLDPVARQVLNYFPLPNQPGNAVTGRAELLRHRHRRAERRQHRRARRPQLLGEDAVVLPLLVPQDLQLAGEFFPEDITIAEGRVNEQNLAHNAVIDYSRTISNTTLMNARLGFARTLFLFDNQGLGFKPSSLGLPVSIDAERRPRDVPAVRRQRHGVARRQRPSLQRVHELHRGGEPHESARRAHAERRLRGADAARERVGGAQRRHVQLPRERDAGAESQHRQQHGGLWLRVVAPRLRPAERRADSELEERRGQQLLLGASTRRTTGGSTRG